MNIPQKMAMLKTIAVSLVDHDDAPLATVEDAVAEIHSFLDQRLGAARARRIEKEPWKAK